MNKKILLIDASYQIQSFITERRAFKLLFKDKVDVISVWEGNYIYWTSGRVELPSILRLKEHSRKNYYNANFSRKALVKRDRSMCQYCGKKLIASQITIDHVLPKAQGGRTTFSNCVACCQPCNNKKADKTPDQANMKLLKKPTHPSFSTIKSVADIHDVWNPDWDDYLENT